MPMKVSSSMMRKGGERSRWSSTKPTSPRPAADSKMETSSGSTGGADSARVPIIHTIRPDRIASPPIWGVGMACRLRRLSGTAMTSNRSPMVRAPRQTTRAVKNAASARSWDIMVNSYPIALIRPMLRSARAYTTLRNDTCPRNLSIIFNGLCEVFRTGNCRNGFGSPWCSQKA
jgi:hypothetical protein